MKMMNEQIRNENHEAAKNSRSKSKAKSLSKSRKSVNYWEKVKS